MSLFYIVPAYIQYALYEVLCTMHVQAVVRRLQFNDAGMYTIHIVGMKKLQPISMYCRMTPLHRCHILTTRSMDGWMVARL